MVLVLVCLGDVLATYPSDKSEWMLASDKGDVFYIDGVNLSKVWTDGAVLHYGMGAKVPSGEALLIENGISKGILKNISTLTHQQMAVSAKWDSLEYLRKHFPVGAPVKIVQTPPFPEFSISFPFDYYNSGKVENNKLWIFTTDYKDNTNNAYRFQAAVSQGRVIARDGGYLSIPVDGFLMSGHGTGLNPSGSTRILNWVGLGCQVDLDIKKGLVTIITDHKTWYLRGQYWLNEAGSFINRNRSMLSADELKTAQDYQNIAEVLYKSATQQTGQLAWDQLRQSMDYAKKAMIHAALSAQDKQLRYIAVADEISERLLEIIKSAGFKGIMLHYDNSNQANLAGLQRTALRADAMGLEVALWSWLPTKFPVPPEIAKKLPIDKDRNGKPCFFDLSSEITRKAYLDELIKVCQKLKIKRVMLDYESYRGGYGGASISAMRKLYPDLPADFNPLKMDARQSELWEKFQISVLKKMTAETLEALKANSILASLCVYPGAKINDLDSGSSASPGPGIWLSWLKDFDSVILMMYSQSPQWMEQRAKLLFPAIRREAPNTKIDAWLIYWPEICGYANVVPLDNILKQTDIMLRMNVDGLSFFHSPNLDAQIVPDFYWIFAAMRNGVYRQITNK